MRRGFYVQLEGFEEKGRKGSEGKGREGKGREGVLSC
jgi:hypothetical protein